MCLTFLFWLLGIIDKIINIYKFSRAHFFFVLNLCFLKIIFDFPSSTGRPERKRHLDCLLVRRRKWEININEVVIHVAIHPAASFEHDVWDGDGRDRRFDNGYLNDAIRTAIGRFFAPTKHFRLATGFNDDHQSDERHETQQHQQHAVLCE